MKIFAMIALVSFFNCANADVKISNMSGFIDDMVLIATADQFMEADGGMIDVEMYSYDNGLVLKYGNYDKFIDEYPAILEELNNVRFYNLNLSLVSTRANLSASRINADGSIIENIKLKCSKGTGTDVAQQILSACTTDSEITIDKASIQNGKRLNDIVDVILGGKGTTDVKDVELEVDDHEFKLKLKADISGFNLSPTIKGDIHALEDGIKIKINSAVMGIFPITNKLFDELEKISNDKLVVKKPYIYFYF